MRARSNAPPSVSLRGTRLQRIHLDLSPCGCAGSNYPFLTLKERDIETGLDYFGVRYYAGFQGRFIGVDSGPFTPADPQSFNRYSYVQSNPLKFIDPNGETLVINGEDAAYFVSELEKRTGYKRKRDEKTGVVTIDESVKRQTGKDISDKLANTLAAAVAPTAKVMDASGNSKDVAFTVTLNTVRDQDNTGKPVFSTGTRAGQ